MGRTVATLFTVSTSGNWLRGDPRGWVEDGIIFPEQPALQEWDRQRMNHPPHLFPRDQWFGVGQAIGQSLRDRLDVRVYGLTVQSWHAHGLIGATRQDIGDVIKCVKDAARWHLNADRPRSGPRGTTSGGASTGPRPACGSGMCNGTTSATVGQRTRGRS